MKRHLPGLDALRAYAALSVIVSHTAGEFYEVRNGAIAYETPFTWFFLSGRESVSLFMVLSGFLITWILLQERHDTGRINLKAFYIRRTLRIFPMYYIGVFVGLWLLPMLFGSRYPLDLTPQAAIASAVFLTSIANAITPLWAAAHLWSVSVEEIYYVSFSFIMRRGKQIGVIIGAVILTRIALGYLLMPVQDAILLRIYHDMRFECLLIGAAGAFAYHRNHWTLRIMRHRVIQRLAWVVVLPLAVVSTQESPLFYTATSLVFLVVILHVIERKSRLDAPVLQTLGKWSYSLYVWHMPVLFIAVLLCAPLWGTPWYWIVLTGGTVMVTIGLSALSYRYIEQPFLRLREREVKSSISGATASAAP